MSDIHWGVLAVGLLKGWTAESLSECSNSSRANAFTFGQIFLGNVGAPSFS